MDLKFEKHGTVGIFNFSGELTNEIEQKLQVVLLRAAYSIERSVLNFKKVSRIDPKCLQLLKQAYATSLRLHNPLIFTDLHGKYLKEISGTAQEAIDVPIAERNEYADIENEAVYN